MSITFSCFISNIVEIGFARPNADDRDGRQIRWPTGTLMSCLCMHIVIEGKLYSVSRTGGGASWGAVSRTTHKRNSWLADVFTACLLPTDLLSYMTGLSDATNTERAAAAAAAVSIIGWRASGSTSAMFPGFCEQPAAEISCLAGRFVGPNPLMSVTADIIV